MRRLALLLLCVSTTAFAAPNPVAQQSKLSPEWQAKTRTMFETAIEIPTVAGRGQMDELANYLAGELKAAGITDVQIMPHEGIPGDQTVSLIARWKAEKPTKKPIIILAHMDVVEAKRSDWKQDPFEFIERDGYFYGRGTSDDKQGVIATTAALLKLKSQGFKPNRDIILFFTGDEETQMNG
ncbi:MAG: M20/M25/M40 family metallo-hydrolase, partial [Alphaproteobacteria bacterium]